MRSPSKRTSPSASGCNPLIARQCRLAGTAFANDRQGFACIDREGHAGNAEDRASSPDRSDAKKALAGADAGAP